MKFLAILRDSVREALDAKVIYFLFGLSALVIVGAFSISFKAESGDKGLQTILDRMPGGRSAGFGQGAPLKYTVEDFKQLNPGKPAWEGEYQYDLVVTESEAPVIDEGDDEEKDKKEKPK